MSVETNAATYRRWFEEGCSQGNVDLADELYSPDYVTHSVGPDFAPTRDGLKLFIRALPDGIPDLNCPVEVVVAEGDRVAGRFSLEGTHVGTLLSIPPTGKRVHVGVMVIARFDEADHTFEIHDQIAQGDLVVNRVTWRGVPSGDIAGVPATGRTIELRGINMFRVKDGLVVEQWAELDMLDLLQQIGAIPT